MFFGLVAPRLGTCLVLDVTVRTHLQERDKLVGSLGGEPLWPVCALGLVRAWATPCELDGGQCSYLGSCLGG